MSTNNFKTMFPYRVKYHESEYDIKNNDLLYKIDQKCQNTFELLEMFGVKNFKNENWKQNNIYI